MLVLGAVVLFAWGFFVLAFLREPSAVGGIFVALLVIGGGSLVAALLGAVAAAGLARGARWAHVAAIVAAVAMIFTGAGAVAGVPALVGILSGRNSTTN